jgi:HK97 family phage portal protein
MALSGLITRILPATLLDKIAQERIAKESMGWSVLAGGTNLTSKLGSRSKQLEAYISHVYKCVNAIKDRVQSIPWKLVYRRGTEEADIDWHPFYDLAGMPNSIWSFQELLAFAIMHLDLCGRGFWRLGREDSFGNPTEIWPLLPTNFHRLLVREDRMEIEGYEFFAADGIKQTAKKVTYLAQDVVDFRYPHPTQLLDGASPIQQMAYSFDTDMAIRIQQRSFFQNAARPDLVFETDQNVSPESMQKFITEWNEKHQGAEQRWSPAVLGKGMKANVLNIPNTDLELIAMMKFSKEDILEAYRVPAGKLGTEANVTKANSFAIDLTFNQECIHPRLVLLQEVISKQILSAYDPNLHLKFDNPIPADRELRLKERESNLKTGYMAINEERAREGLESVPWGQVPIMPMTMLEFGATSLPAETPKGFTLKALKTDQGRTRFWQLQNRRILTYSRPLEKWLKQFFKDLRREVNSNISNQWKRYLGLIYNMSNSKARQWAEENKQWETLNFDVEAAKKRLREEGLPFVEQIMVLAGEDAFQFLEVIDLDFDLANPRVIGFLRTRENLLVNIADDIFEKIRGELIEGIEAAESVGQLQARINDRVWNNAQQVRSLRVARTESATATNRGNLEAYMQTGLVERKEWLSAGDARSSHLNAAAKYQGDGAIPINEDFILEGGSGPCPGNIGVAAEDINCRCALMPIIEE